MKFIKENLLPLIVILVFLFLIVLNFNSKGGEAEAMKKVKVLESEKTILKKEVAKREVEIKKNKEIVKKTQIEKDNIAKEWNLDKQNSSDMLKSLRKRLKKRHSTRIVYKEVEIKKTDSQERLFNFGNDVYFSLLNYRAEDLKERAKNKKIISDLELSLSSYKEINAKSEKQIQLIKDIANGWSFGYGGHFGFGNNGLNVSVGISYSKRFKKIK